MARVRTREEALLNAYLNRYQNVQASTVNSGGSAAQSAQSKGSALMNSTEKTLPEVKDYSADVYNGIIKSADRDQNLTVTAAKAYQKEQEEAAKAAEKAAAKSRRSSGKSSRKSSGKAADSDSDTTDVSAAVNELLGGTAKDKPQSNTTKKKVTDANSGATAQAERNASARKKYDGSEQEKSDKKYRQEQKNQKIQRTLNEKQNGNPGKTGNSYAERRAAAQGTQSRAVTSVGKQVGSSYAAAGQAPTEREIAAGQQMKKQTADTLQKLQTDNDYLAELAKPGRKLTQSEINAVKQYGRNANDLYKEYQDGKISVSEYNQQAQDLARVNQKASLNGLGQGMQAFTSGLMTSVPFLKQADKAVKSLGGDAYSKAIEDGVIPDTLETLQGYQDQNKLAAAAGTMAGKSAQYATFNNLMAGTHLADTMGKVGGKVMGAASKIPGLERFATPAAGEALGRILTDQTADTALDTIPSFVNDLAAYDEQQGRIKNGEQVDDAMTPGQIGLNVLGNVGQNFAMNALPEIGGAVVNGIKNSRTAQRMLDEQAQALADGTLQNDAAMLLRSNDLTPTENLPIDNAGRQAQNEVTGGIANGTTDLGGTIPADIPVLSDGGKRLEPQPGENGIGVSGTAGAGREAAEAAGNGARAAADGAADSTDVGSWASAITGKDRRSALTRRVEDLGQRIASGENRDTLLRDANDIAARIVKESDFAEQTDHAATVLRDYMKNTPIRLDEQTAGELLYTSGLKNLGQYNIQNGTNFSTKKGLDFDVAMQELNGMNVGLNGEDNVDALLDAVTKSKAKPAVDEVYASAYTEYVRDTLLDGAQKGGLSEEGFSDWLEVQGFNEDAPAYVRKMYERQNGYNPWRGTNYNQNVLNRAEDVPTENPGALGLERQTAESVSAEVPAVNREAVPLNGSESLHPNTVGSKEREMPYQEYAGRGHSVTDIDRDTLTPENQNILGTNAPYTVQRISHAEQQANAQQIRSNEGLSATIDRIVKDSTSGNFNDETETLAGNTLRELNEKLNTLEPNTTEYAKTATQARIVRSKMREGLTKTARTLESAKQFTTPEKAVMNIEGILSDARDAAQKKNPGAFKKAQTAIENAVEGGRSEANAQLGEIVTNELSKIVGAGKQAAGNGNIGQAASAAQEVPVLDNPEDAWARAVARKTGNYAQDNLKKANPDDLFAKEIVNQLFETAKESPVAQGARAKNGYTAQAKLNLAFDAQDDYATVWNKARAIAQKNYKNNPDMTSRMQAFFDNVKDEGSLYSNKTVLSAFTENLKENDDTFRQLADRAAFGNKSEISRAANRLADAVEVPDKYRSGFLKTAESVLANSKQLTGAQAHADGRAFRAALNRAGFTVGDIADASAFGNDISPVMAAHEIMETLNPPAEYRQTVFDNVYNYIKNNDGYQKQTEKADSRVLRRLVSNVDGGYTSIANKAAFGSDAGMQATVNDFLDEINAPTSLRGEMGERLQKAITGNTQYQKAAAGADSRVFNEAVRHVQEELEFTFQKLSGESDASKAKVLDGLKNTITDYLGVDDNQAAEVVQNIEKMYNSALSDGAMKRLAQIFPDTNKAANAPRDQFLELLRSGAYNDEYMGEAVKDLAATKFGIQQLSDEQVANIKQLAEQMETLPKDSKARVNIENEIATIAAGNVKGSFWDKWNAMRYTGMLFNAVTNIKNAVNNVGQGTLALLKDGVNGAVQRVAKAMGNDTAEVTVGYLNPASKADRNLIGRSFADADNSRWRQLTGTSENFEMAKAARNAGQTFNTRVMRTIDQMSSAMLEDADVYGTSGLLSFAKPLNENNALRKAAEFAQDATKRMGENGFIGVAGLKNNYSRYLASYLKAHGATDAIFDATDDASKAMLEQARDYAVQQALVNTYHEANKLTEFIGKVKKSANDVPILGAWVEGQLPFVKTPTNVGIQAWRYSPGGLVQGLLQMGYDAAKGKDINKAMDTFSAGLTGSAIAGLGAYLWSTGHLVPGMTDEEKAEADLTGAQENSLQFTDENGKLHSYTINWFSNWAGPMMVGANLAKLWDTRNDTGTSVVDKVLNACVSVLDPVIDNSYLTSLNNTIDQLGNAQTGGEKAATLLTSGFGNYFTQAIPTLSGQLTRTIDPTRRSTYTGLTGAAKNFSYFGQKSKNKIPVLSQSSEPYIDVWGNEEKNFTPASGEDASDYAARAAYNFLSPGYYSESDGDEVSQYVEELYKSTGDKNVLPKNSSARGYTVSVPSLDGGDSTEQRLTPQEKTAYDKAYGQTAYDLIDELRQNSMFLRLPEDQQSALVQEAYSVAKTVGGVAAVGDGVSGVDSKEYQAYEDGGTDGLVNYMLAKNAVDVAKGDADSISKTDKWAAVSGTLSGDAAASAYVAQSSKDSVERRVYDAAGESGLTAYMNAYSSISAGLEEGKEPSQKQMTAALLKAGLNDTDLAKTYFSVYSKDEKGAAMYSKYGTSGLKSWLAYITVADTDGNGSINQTEAKNALNAMDLTEELKRAYWQNTNKSWKANKNPY